MQFWIQYETHEKRYTHKKFNVKRQIYGASNSVSGFALPFLLEATVRERLKEWYFVFLYFLK